jgi:hypothetical protein
MDRVVAIHQPNFFPWLGYFDKMRRADVFVFLDDVQYQKTGGTWSNRVKVMVRGEETWLTAPLDRSFHGTRRINEIRFQAGAPWREKLRLTLQAAYGRTAFFRETMQLLEPLLNCPEDGVAAYNIHAIQHLARAIGLGATTFVHGSSIPSPGTATQRLIDITTHLGGKHYLCGGGASGYQQDELFDAAGIGLQYQHFVHPEYAQHGGVRFVPGLSVIDALMNCGASAVATWFQPAAARSLPAAPGKAVCA